MKTMKKCNQGVLIFMVFMVSMVVSAFISPQLH